MAEAGPGPSSMAFSPMLSGSTQQLKGRRRIVNLVNPADPSEFSGLSISMEVSETTQGRTRERDNTPPSRAKMLLAEEMPQTFTPTGMKDGVKGILRPSGTPGSGQGVRFLPKNRFRVITPNQSINPEPIAVAPPSPASNSFLSQLLAVTMPSMSPRRPPSPPHEPSEESIDPDESWEVPGQEGEVSLVASSTGDRSLAISEEEAEEEPWTGTPQVHSSPLGLTISLPDTSMDGVREDEAVGMASRDMQLPADMSDLMTQKLSVPGEVDSFSISDFSRTKRAPTSSTARNELSGISEAGTKTSPSRSFSFTQDKSSLSVTSHLNDSNPTIRRQLSPLPARVVSPKSTSPASKPAPITPPAKTFTSIFADMSAEQADLAWPLSAAASPLRSELGDNTNFHSIILNDPSPNKAMQLVSSTLAPPSATKTPGNATEFFDCASPSPSPSVPSLTSSGDTFLSRTPSPFAGPHNLLHPAKAMFEAHSAHTNALSAELQLYRQLAQKLQAEVSERDGVLANLNLRVIEGEMMRAKVDELEKALKSATIEQRSAKLDRRSSVSPSARTAQLPSTPEHVGDRTTAGQAANRDLEIRLAKALADQEALTAELDRLQSTQNDRAREFEDAQERVVKSEEREREAAVQAQRREEDLRVQLDTITQRELAIVTELKETKLRAEEAEDVCARAEESLQKVGQLERRLKEMKEVKIEDDEEMARLSNELSHARANVGLSESDQARIDELEGLVEAERELRRELESDITQERHEREEEHRAELDGLEQRLDEVVARSEQLEREVEAEREARAEVELELEQVRQTLEETKADLLARLNAPSAAPASDIAKMRAESASKDLEIVTLQRRKNELKEDVEMLNIALDSKQQELELLKRRYAVKGVAGATPLGASRKTNFASTPAHTEIETPAPGRIGMNTRRRSSAAFVTPSIVGGTGRMLKSGMTSTTTTQRTMRKVEEENRAPLPVLGSGREDVRESVRGSMRRERVLA